MTAISLFIELPAFLKFFSGLIQVFVLPGLIFFFLAGDRERPVTDTIFITPLISPVIFSITALLVTQLVPGFLLAVRLSAGLFYIILAAALFSGRAQYGRRELNLPGRVILLSCGYGALIGLMYLFNSVLLIRSDAWYHASVVNEIVARGVPPMEPWLNGQPIRYMWIYHFFIAVWKTLSGIELFWGLGFLNLVSAFTLPYLLGRMVSYFVSGAKRIFYSTLMGLAGLESAAWIMFPTVLIKPLTGEVKGKEELIRIIENIDLTGQGILTTLAPLGTWMVNLSDKYITITAFSFALNLFIFCFIIFLSRSFISRCKLRSMISIFLITAGAYLFHVVIGMALVSTIVGSGILLLLFGKFAVRDEEKLSNKLLPSVMAVLVFIAALPYFVSLGGAESKGGSFLSEHLHFGLRNLITIAMPLIVLFLPARRLIRKFSGSENRNYLLLLAWIIPLLALNLFADLPIRGESKLIFPLFILLGSLIGIEIFNILRESVGRKKKLLFAFFSILFFIPPVMTFGAFIITSPGQDAIEPKNKEILKIRHQIYKSDKELFRMIESRTDRYAVIMEKDLKHLAPVFASRRNLTANMKFYRVYGYDLDVVRDNYRINQNIFSLERLSEDTLRFLKATDQNLFFLLYGDEAIESEGLIEKFEERSDIFDLVISHQNGRLYVLRNR